MIRAVMFGVGVSRLLFALRIPILGLSIVGGLLLSGSVSAQNRPMSSQARAQRASSAAAIGRASDIDFAVIYRAISEMSYEAGQIRRVRDGSKAGQWVGVRERIHHDVDLTGGERFRLDYVEPVGANIPEQEKLRRRDLYTDKAGFIYTYQGFRVYDVKQAEANYRIYPIVRLERLGRPVERVLVYPVRWDRSIWLLDLDVETGYPLYSGEYNNRAQLLSEVLVEAFNPGSTALTADTSWKPTMVVRPFQNPRDAMNALGSESQDLIEEGIDGLPPGYERSTTQIVENLYGERNYVSIFTDGIDNVFVIQTPNSDSPFGQLGNTIAEYRDLNVAQYAFYVKNVRFLILGRSALELRSAVESIYHQAVR